MISGLSFPAAAQSGRKFYIDYSGGSNSNPGTQAAPWKSHPYMQLGAGCTGTGGAPAYSHQAGDQFIFKGGVTWPVACFEFAIIAGGNSTAQDYYGVCNSALSSSPCYGGTSWPATGWTRPIFDMGNSVPSGNVVIQAGPLSGALYVTLDGFEIKGQAIDFQAAAAQSNFGSGCGILLNTYSHGAQENVTYGVGTVVENVYIHDWIGIQSATAYNLSEGCFGGIMGAFVLQNSTISDRNGTAGGQGLPFGGGCHWCGTVSSSHFSYGWFGVVDQPLSGQQQPVVRDCEFDHINQNVSGSSNPNVHTHIIYDNQTATLYPSIIAYNNAIHDSSPGISVFIGYNTDFYNNVIWNNQNGTILNPFGGPGDSSSYVGHWYNNTMDTAGGGSTSCLAERQSSGGSGGSISGTFNYKNNICIGTAQGGGWNGGAQNIAANLVMSASEQATYGFTSANKYAPTSSDPNVVSKGVNLLTSLLSLLSPSSNLDALKYDAAGASWFGGSYNARSTAWDLGAFVTNAQSSSKPNPPSSLSAVVQ
jgi:hypothetical protein